MFGIYGELPAQPKFELAQLVVPGVIGLHGCKSFPDGTKLLFNKPLIFWCSPGFQKTGAHALGEDLEERDGISYALEVGWDVQPLAELAPLAPGGGVFLEDCGGEAM